MERTKGPYNIGDLLIIPGGHKFGIIIDEYKKKCKSGYAWRYTIFWQYSNGETETVEQGELTIKHWFCKKINPNNQNEYHKVPV